MAAKARTTRLLRAWPWLALAVVLALLGALLYSPGFKAMVEEATAWATAIMEEHPVLGAAIFFLFSALSAMLAFASTAVLVPPATVVWGQVITFLLLWGGWVAGAAVAYGIGAAARPLLNRLGYKASLEKYQQLVSKRMKFWGVLLFCLAIPSEIPGYLFGGMHYPFAKFIAAMAIAEAVYALGIVVAGDSLAEARPLPLVLAGGAVIAIGLGAYWRLRVRKKGR